MTERPPDHGELPSAEALLDLITQWLTQRHVESIPLDEAWLAHEGFRKLHQNIMDMRTLTYALSQGDLQKLVYGKGFLLSNLKALQSNLRHLTWQTQMIAEGDFSQRVDYLGDFSIAFNEMVEKLENMSTRLTHMASFDALTQVPNRLSAEQYIEHTIQRVQADKRWVTVMLMDIDHFKLVNDQYGHDAGDQVLIQVSNTLYTLLRGKGLFARFGGEEFIAILPDVPRADARDLAEKLLKIVRGTQVAINSDRNIQVTISIGVDGMRPEDTSHKQMLKRCDQAMYWAKESGRDKACIWEEERAKGNALKEDETEPGHDG